MLRNAILFTLALTANAVSLRQEETQESADAILLESLPDVEQVETSDRTALVDPDAVELPVTSKTAGDTIVDEVVQEFRDRQKERKSRRLRRKMRRAARAERLRKHRRGCPDVEELDAKQDKIQEAYGFEIPDIEVDQDILIEGADELEELQEEVAALEDEATQ